MTQTTELGEAQKALQYQLIIEFEDKRAAFGVCFKLVFALIICSVGGHDPDLAERPVLLPKHFFINDLEVVTTEARTDACAVGCELPAINAAQLAADRKYCTYKFIK